jgi:putative phosphoribosyl transferase
MTRRLTAEFTVSGAFTNRKEAGRKLGASLARYGRQRDLLVLGLPRGGVPVAAEVAYALKAPLDVCVVRKLGAPSNPELAMGAVAANGVQILNPDVIRGLSVSPSDLETAIRRETEEVSLREARYRSGRCPAPIQGRTVVIVDDGIATGATMRAAIAAVRAQFPARLIVAAPVAAAPSLRELKAEADEVVTLHAPDLFIGVGQWYLDFTPTSEAEVTEILTQLQNRPRSISATKQPTPTTFKLTTEEAKGHGR